MNDDETMPVRRARSSRDGLGSRRSLYRAEKCLVLRRRYELLAASQNLPIPPPIAEIFQRVPPMPPDITADEYLLQVKDAVTWADVDSLDEAIIAIIPSQELPEQLELQRLVYSQMVDSDEFVAYVKVGLTLSSISRPIQPDIAAQLRSEMLAVTQRIKYVLIYGPPKEEARSALSNRVITGMVIGSLCICVLYVAAQLLALRGIQFVPPEAVFLVLLSGLVGGFISVQQRLQQPSNVDPLYKWLELDASGRSLLISPVVGMTFALVLFAALVGGFVKGDLFPSFVGCHVDNSIAGLHCARSDFASFAYGAVPDSPASWAKLTVWAFAAGFLERLVPDILTRIASVAEKS